MVKGVNKTVIEINDTGSKVFEKVVFYVSPKYSTLTAKQLSRAAQNLNINSEDMYGKFKPLRQRWFKRKAFSVCLFVCAVIGTALGVYFLFIK